MLEGVVIRNNLKEGHKWKQCFQQASTPGLCDEGKDEHLVKPDNLFFYFFTK